ncbi:MAG: CPBP family intramembrane metalloprotease [Planctomycetes bacterium]|nr:CPBP family intramembrane metalloprotease [Planctomycetota bacterium]
MLLSLAYLVALLPVLGLTGLVAMAAFSVLYLNGVAPDRFEVDDLRRQQGPVLPDTRISGLALLIGFLILFFVPTGLLHFDLIDKQVSPAAPERLVLQSAGLFAALLFLLGLDRGLGGSGMFPWGGAKLSRPVFAFVAILPLLAVVVTWNRHLVEGVFSGALPTELVAGMHQLEGGALWLSLGMAVFIGPALEELLFRGAAFAAAARMAKQAGHPPFFLAVVFPAVAFAALHPPTVWLPILFLGLILGCVRLHGYGLRDCILLHAAYNLVAFLLTFPSF